MAAKNASLEDSFRKWIRQSLPQSGSEYDTIRDQVVGLSQVFRNEITDVIQKSLNDYVRSRMPHKTYEEKKAAAAWINAELLALGGFSLRCPKTGRPSLLRACPGRHPDVGRWRFEDVDNRGVIHNYSSSDELPELILLPESRRPGTQQSRKR
jgi:hypothetical protein